MVRILNEDQLEARNNEEDPFRKPAEKFKINKILDENGEDTFISHIITLRNLKKKQKYY